MDPITVRYQLTRAQVVSQLFRLMMRPKLVALTGFVGLCGVVGLVVLSERTLWVWFALSWPAMFAFFLYRTVVKIVAQHPEFLEEQTLTFDETSLTFVNSVARLAWPWQRVTKFIETEDYYIIRLDSMGSGGIVPRRALSADEAQRFVACAKSRAA